MKLSELEIKKYGGDLLRDGEFYATSKLGFPHTVQVLSFITAEKYISLLTSSVSCIITTPDLVPLLSEDVGLIVTDNVKGLFGYLHNITAEYQLTQKLVTYPEKTIIGEGCRIHPSAYIAPTQVRIGGGVEIGPNVVINERVSIGDRCKIMSGVNLGDYGLEYSKFQGRTLLCEHLGGLCLGNDVYIHANSCISRALFVNEQTILGDNVIVDCLTYIAHSVKVDSDAIICAGCTIAGSAHISSGAYLGMNCGVRQLMDVGTDSLVGMNGVVVKNVSSGQTVVGNPIHPIIRR